MTSNTFEEASTYIHAEQSLVPENITTVNKLNGFNAVMWSIHQYCVLQRDFVGLYGEKIPTRDLNKQKPATAYSSKYMHGDTFFDVLFQSLDFKSYKLRG